MGYTITEKILSKHFGGKAVNPGDFILAEVDLSLGNDIRNFAVSHPDVDC